MEREELTIALIQTELFWEDPVANCDHFDSHFENVNQDVDIVILPEMFTSGFTMNPQSVAEEMNGQTIQWLKTKSKQLNTAICGSLAITEDNHYYNRFVFVKPDGSITSYDKRHTFNLAGEGEKYEAGTKQVLIEYLGWKIFPQVCYDLRFPVYARNTMGYDIVLYVANWPKTRIAAWDTLLQARAIENMSYAIGVNRVGLDGNRLEYVGHSGVYDTLGTVQTDIAADEAILYTTLSKKHIDETRAKLPFLIDKDSFTLQ